MFAALAPFIATLLAARPRGVVFPAGMMLQLPLNAAPAMTSKYANGRSLEANVAFAKNNAILAAAISREIANMYNLKGALPEIKTAEANGSSK
ncbi:MAG: hypothetical protein OXC66_07995 [Roseovarius sp.]|nr:hypothetical protein [Roseovarius sp.]